MIVFLPKKMKKQSRRLLSILLTLALTLCMFPITASAAGSITLTLTLDKTDVHPGDEVSVTVSISSAAGTNFAGFQFDMDVSNSLTYKSSVVDESFIAATNFKEAHFEAAPHMRGSGYSDLGGYNGFGLDMMTITYTVNNNASSGPANINLKNHILSDNKGDLITSNVVATNINIKQTQSISWEQDFSGINTQSAPITLTATASSQLPVSYESSNENIFTVTGDILTVHGVGTAVLTAKQEGTSSYNAAVPVSKNIRVSGTGTTSQTISWDQDFSGITTQSAPITLTATADSQLPVSYESSNENIAKVTVSGAVYTLNIVGPGELTVTAYQGGDDTYIAAMEPKTFTVSDATAPTVTSVLPAGINAAVNGNIVVTFSKPMDKQAGTITLSSGGDRFTMDFLSTTGTWNAEGTVYSIPYTGLANSTTYTVHLTGFEDISGNPLASRIASFTTIAADTATSYSVTISSNPANGGTVNPTNDMYTPGNTVNIYATPNAGYKFTGWQVNFPGGLTLSDPGKENTDFLMPSANVDLRANFALSDGSEDNNQPRVSSVSPSGSNNAVNGTLNITFSKSINPGPGKVELSPSGTLGAGSWNNDHTVYNIPYSSLANATTYTINISEFTDTDGNVMAMDSTHKFTTASNGGGGGGGGGGSSNTTLSPAKASASLDSDGKYQDISFTVNKSASNTINALKNGNITLVKGTDYLLEGNKIIIKGDYLATLQEGDTKITVDLQSGTDPVFTINKGVDNNTTTPQTTESTESILPAQQNITAPEQTIIIMQVGDINYTVNGITKTADAVPAVNNSRTYVPYRLVAEAFNARVQWDATTKQVTISDGGITIVMTVGSKSYTVNGETRQMDAEAYINNGRTMTPIRFIAEALGAKVDWNTQNKVVTITR